MSRLYSSCLVVLVFFLSCSAFPTRDANAQSASDIADVQAASNAFYEALASDSRGDAMADVWARKAYATNLGPRSKSVDSGWDAVSDYWTETEENLDGNRRKSGFDQHGNASVSYLCCRKPRMGNR